MAAVNDLVQKFSRTYIYLNPNPFKGPNTWRLSNIPGAVTEDDSDTIQNLYTVPPIRDTSDGSTINLYFDIDSIAKTAGEASGTSSTPARRAWMLATYAPYKRRTSAYSLKKITGQRPIATEESGRDVTIFFDLTGLKSIEEARGKRRMQVNFKALYNSRSIDALTATAPLYSNSNGEIATVSFDISQLPEA
jgi:hypothetical protein